MNYPFSRRINAIKPSAVDGLLAQMRDPTLINLAGGNPAPDSFPIEQIRALSEELLTRDPIDLLQYNLAEGHPILIREARRFFNRDGVIAADSDEIIITSGSQQIIDFAAKTLCDDDDVVVCENPSFMMALDALRGNGVRLVGVDLEDDGVNLAQLEAAFQAKPTPKLFYTIPNFQNPTGITLSGEKRRAIYDLAVKYGVVVLEDDPYGELRFSGEFIPSIKSLDREGLVISARSFSKIMSPGLRVAAAIAPKPIAAKLKTCKSLNDTHTGTWGQMICARILQTYDMEAHLQRIRQIYGSKFSTAIREIEEHFHPSVKHTRPDGGMFIWATLPDGVSVEGFIQEALKERVALVPGSVFFVDSSLPCQSFRISFSTPGLEDIAKGIRSLGKLTHQLCN